MFRALYFTYLRLLRMLDEAALSLRLCTYVLRPKKQNTPITTRISVILRAAYMRKTTMRKMKLKFSSLHPSDSLEKYIVAPHIYQVISKSSFIMPIIVRKHFLRPRWVSQYTLLFIRSRTSTQTTSSAIKKKLPANHGPSGMLHLGVTEKRQRISAITCRQRLHFRYFHSSDGSPRQLFQLYPWAMLRSSRISRI